MSWGAVLGGPLTGPGFFLTGDTSDYLQEVQLPLIPFALCQVFYGHTYLLPDMMCAGDPGNLKTMCEVRPTVGTGSQAQGFHVFICFKPPWTLLLSRWGGSLKAWPLWGLGAHHCAAIGWAGNLRVAYVQMGHRPQSVPSAP